MSSFRPSLSPAWTGGASRQRMLRVTLRGKVSNVWVPPKNDEVVTVSTIANS